MFSFGREAYSYWQSLIRLVYPASCPVCRIPLLLNERYLCSHCTLKIKPIPDPKCIKCARPLPPYGPTRTLCPVCISKRPAYHRGFALVTYEPQVKTIFHEIKFQKKPWLLKVFSKLLSDFVHSSLTLTHYDLVVPIPLDWRKARERGFNQAEIIARMLKNYSPHPTLSLWERGRGEGITISSIIQKTKKTVPQSQLRRHERLNNLNRAFSIKRPGEIKGKHILLVDDIFTTGSTVNECARLLKEHGAERVDFFTIARS